MGESDWDVWFGMFGRALDWICASFLDIFDFSE